jgi:hypothetical protein
MICCNLWKKNGRKKHRKPKRMLRSECDREKWTYGDRRERKTKPLTRVKSKVEEA